MSRRASGSGRAGRTFSCGSGTRTTRPPGVHPCEAAARGSTRLQPRPRVPLPSLAVHVFSPWNVSPLERWGKVCPASAEAPHKSATPPHQAMHGYGTCGIRGEHPEEDCWPGVEHLLAFGGFWSGRSWWVGGWVGGWEGERERR